MQKEIKEKLVQNNDGWKKRFVVKRAARGMGYGMYARVAVKKGNFILEYTGKLIPTPVANTMSTRYLFEINTKWTIDGATRTNVARYINHSCDPNCEVFIEKGRIIIYAWKDIEKGDELTFDYGEEYMDEFFKKHGCQCGTAICRKPLLNAPDK